MRPKEESSAMHGSRLIYKCDNCDFLEDSGEHCVYKVSYKAESR